MDKRSLTERDICTKYITPALERAGWDVHDKKPGNLTRSTDLVVGESQSDIGPAN